MKINLFDFDETIYDGDSTRDFFIFSLRRYPKIMVCVPGILYNCIKYFIGLEDKTEMKEHIIKLLAVSFSKLAKHYRCECAASDEITMESSNKKKGKKFNRLVNNKWNRNVYDETIQKNNQLNGLYVDGVYSAYTSVNGNFVFRSLDYQTCVWQHWK